VILPAKAPTAGPINFRNISATDCPAVTDSVSISPSIAARFGVSFEQACHRLSTLQRVEARGVPFFFLRVDPAGNVSKRFSAGFRLRAMAVRVPAGWCIPRFRGRVRCRCRWPNCRTARRICALPARWLSRWHAGDSRGRSMWWRWAARWRMRGMPFTPTAWTWTALGSASACPAGYVTAPTAAAGRFRRWNTGWRWTR
jgi:hypothetical protein